MRVLDSKPNIPEYLNSIESAAKTYLHTGVRPKYHNKFNFIDTFPCPNCEGSGIKRDWTGIGSDYNEETCKTCDATGLVNQRTFSELYYCPTLEYYKNELKRWQTQKEEYKEVKNLIKARKLSKKELELLKKWL